MSEYTQAVLTGINMMLLLSTLDAYAAAGLTSSSGRARVFDTHADGFIRGEGCGASVLHGQGMESTEVAVLASIAGSAVRQDGRSASLTAPNGRAQKLLLHAVLMDSCMASTLLSLAEAAANGSHLGDPIEVGAIVSSVLTLPREAALMCGSAKANVGHTESASGMVGLTKVVCALCRTETTPTAHLAVCSESVSSAIQCATAPLVLPQQRVKVAGEAVTGSVSSFGLGGTIASSVLRAHRVAVYGKYCNLTYNRRSLPWQTPLSVHLGSPGMISAILLREQPAFESSCGDFEAEIQVRTLGLNFRDVLLVLDEYPGVQEPPGGDCCGIVCTTGSSINGVCRGTEMFGLSPGCLLSFVRSRGDARLLTRRPRHVAAVPACTLPVVWCTVHQVLRQGAVRGQQKFLVHAAAGGVGLAAAEYLHWLATLIIATVGSPGKAGLVHGLDVARVCSSRDASAFALGSTVQLLKLRLNGACSSLTGDFTSVSIAHMKEYASFHEIGKRAAWSAVRVAAASLAPYSLVDLASDIQQDVSWFNGMLCRLTRGLCNGVTSGLPSSRFWLHEVHIAFHLLKAGDSVGKVILCSQFAAIVDAQLKHPVHAISSILGGHVSHHVKKAAPPLAGIIDVIQQIAKGAIDADAPLMDAGITSLGAIELRNKIQVLVGTQLPGTIMFEHPSARQLSIALARTALGHRHPISRLAGITQGGARSERRLPTLSMRGLVTSLPAGASTVRATASVMRCGAIVVNEVPAMRWSKPMVSQQAGLVAQRVRYGAFVRGAELSDNTAFGISPAETMAMDPQQRLLLTGGYAALHGGQYPRVELVGSPLGIFLGIASTDFAQLQMLSPTVGGVYSATGCALSVASGRLSYVHGLHGPCASYDTACSAALVACHAASCALSLVECPAALVAGVTLMLTPAVGITFALAGMTSANGRSFTFDTRADGFARGETCGALVLRQPVQVEVADFTLCLTGSAVRQDGRSASLTAPSGRAQQMLLQAAVVHARVASAELCFHEAHGTGTALGDPIESRSISETLIVPRDMAAASPLLVCGAKANLAHAEPAAGMSGLLSTTVSLHMRTATANAQLRALNHHVSDALAAPMCMLPLQSSIMPELGRSHVCGGVSSFGFSGTICHVFASEQPRAASAMIAQPAPNFRRTRFAWLNSQACALASPVSLCAVSWKKVVLPYFVPARAPHVLITFSVKHRGALVRRTPSATPAVTLLCGSSATCSAINAVHTSILQLAAQHPLLALRIITHGTQFASSGAYLCPISNCAFGGAWGLSRVLRLEIPVLSLSVRDVNTCYCRAAWICNQLIFNECKGVHLDVESSACEAELRVPRLRVHTLFPQRSRRICPFSYMITGGLGGLGLRAAALVLQHGANCVYLTSRFGRATHQGHSLIIEPAELSSTVSSLVYVAACDSRDRADLNCQLTNLTKSPMNIWHAAAVLSDQLFSFMTQLQFDRVVSAKASAASFMHNSTMCIPLESIGFFSSTASLLGSVGQANYAAANAFLDVFALKRRLLGVNGAALQIPAVYGPGMSESVFSSAQLEAYGCITFKQLAASLLVCFDLGQPASLATLSPLKRELLQSNSNELFADEICGSFSSDAMHLPPSHGESSQTEFNTLDADAVQEMVLRETRRVVGANNSLVAETALMDGGLDSLGAVELASQLSSKTLLDLSPTLVFEYPTARAIAKYIAELSGGSASSMVSLCHEWAIVAATCISSIMGWWPSSECRDVKGQHHLLGTCGDAVTTSKPPRWPIDDDNLDCIALNSSDALCMQHGGFIMDVDAFPHTFFGLSIVETCTMDPQQRILLDLGYAVMHRSSYRRMSPLRCGDAFFLGIERPDWALIQPPLTQMSVYSVTSDNISVAAGRLCYLLDLHGPCSSVDTACSSALVAAHGARGAVNDTESSAALAMAVSLKLAPINTARAAKAGMLSQDGRCKTFDVRANGYVRSEGIGGLVLTMGPSSSLCNGSRVRQDGRSASLTAPNGTAQRMLLGVSFVHCPQKQGVVAIEAHGTGTALGDPTEARALHATFCNEDRALPLAIGAVKTNVGHGEAASGQQNILKALSMLRRGPLAHGSANLRQLNQTIAPIGERLLVDQQTRPIPQRSNYILGVSSFGYSGTIAHVVIGHSNVISDVCRPLPVQLFLRRRAFPWRDPTHPFVQRTIAATDAFAYCSRAIPPLLALVANHVVQGRIVFPGAGYLELARASWSSVMSSSSQTSANIDDVFFLQPLLVEIPDMLIECLLSATGKFEVLSSVPGRAQSTRVVHSSGAIRAEEAGVLCASPDSALHVCRCIHAVDPPSLYDVFHSIGLQYGPTFRPQREAWNTCNGHALSQLQSGCHRFGANVLPSELDGAFQLCALAAPKSRRGETRLPFAGAGVKMRSRVPHRRLWSAVTEQSDDAVLVSMFDMSSRLVVQLDKFTSRVMRISLHLPPTLRWLYTVEWSSKVGGQSRPCPHTTLARARVLVLGHVPGALRPDSQVAHMVQHASVHAEQLSTQQWDSVLLTASLYYGATDANEELSVISRALSLMQGQMVSATCPPLWMCTRRSQNSKVDACRVASAPTYGGLWGLGRAGRQEILTLPAFCMSLHHDDVSALHRLLEICCETLSVQTGSVRGLQMRASSEPEAMLCGVQLHVPRLVAPHSADVWSTATVTFHALQLRLDTHCSASSAGIPMAQLGRAYTLLDELCREYARDAVLNIDNHDIPLWHHRLLFSWCASLPATEHGTIATDVSAEHPSLCVELQLAERCGPRMCDALIGRFSHQELLFPGGSLDAVRPVYEEAATAAFYNGCVVAAIEGALSLLMVRCTALVLEIGAGTGGTASSVLPVLEGCCALYTFTDVSEVFLRRAQARFASFSFVEYSLLNIDADPRLQGLASRGQDLLIATNVLHATPFMRNTLSHCQQLLRKGGLLIVNEALSLIPFAQITFGLTSGWWLFAESRDPERVGQASPLLCRRQWESLLASCDFVACHCMQGPGFLKVQAVMVAQSASATTRIGQGDMSEVQCSKPVYAQILSGGLGGLGLLTARLLVQGGATHLVLLSRTNQVVAGSKADWEWLASSDCTIKRVRCDVAEESDVVKGTAICLIDPGPGGVFHAAHKLVDATLAKQIASNFRTVYAPKVHGSEALHRAMQRAPLAHFNFYSSAAGLMGSAGQAPHSAANARLDTMAAYRRAAGVRAQSTNWGAVEEIGYAARHGADRRAALSGSGSITRSMACRALHEALLPGCSSFAVFPADWSKLLRGDRRVVCGFTAPYMHLAAAATADVLPTPLQMASSSASRSGGVPGTVNLDVVLKLVQSTAGGTVHMDSPLMEAGIDSLGAVELRTQLQHVAGEGTALPGTLVFDHPTARQLAQFFTVEQDTCDSWCGHRVEPLSAGGCVEVASSTAVLPAGANSMHLGWRMLVTGSNGFSVSPATRWLLALAPERTSIRYGAFIHAVESFDSATFGIPTAEACSMDPQQRMLLEVCYDALHTMALQRSVLAQSDTAVYVGIMSSEFRDVLSAGQQMATGYRYVYRALNCTNRSTPQAFTHVAYVSLIVPTG